MHDKSDTNNIKDYVQIDYDATTNERSFYLHLLKALRQNLPSKSHIAITALASWAMDDRWVPPGSADEAIVMLFSMGGEKKILNSLGKKELSVGDGIDTSIGISVNEPVTNDLLSPAECDSDRRTSLHLQFNSVETRPVSRNQKSLV